LEGARSRGWHINTPTDPAERAGTVSIECPHAREVTQELLARNIMVDFRPKAGVRLSPHFYNRDEEIDFVLEQIAEILKTNAWEKSSEARSGRRAAASRA
jgi:kynureninase